MNQTDTNLDDPPNQKDRGFSSRPETMVVELIPKEWEIGDSDSPRSTSSLDQREVIVGAHENAERPPAVSPTRWPSGPDFHTTWSPGIIELIEPMQRYINGSSLAIREHHLGPEQPWVYSPRFIERNDLEYGGPGSTFRLKNEAVEMMLSGRSRTCVSSSSRCRSRT